MISKALLTVACVSLIAPNAFAADHFQTGCTHYKTGNFAKAKNELQLAVKANSAHWQAHYQLANSLLQLKDPAGAKVAYQNCLNSNPIADIKKHCETAIAYLSGPPPAQRPTSRIAIAARTTGSSSEDTSKALNDVKEESSDAAPLSAREVAIEQRKAMIRADEKRQIEALKAEENAAMQDGNASANHRWKNIETGERFTGMTAEEKGLISSEFAPRLSKIHEETERRLRGCVAP